MFFRFFRTIARRFAHAESGASAVEFALILPVLGVMLAGTVDFSLAMWNQMQVGNAARAGAGYAVAYGYDSAKISTAITSATGATGVSASPAPAQSCGCPSGTSAITPMTCGAVCTNGATAGTYVTSSARSSYSLIFPWPGMSNPVSLSATTTVRIN